VVTSFSGLLLLAPPYGDTTHIATYTKRSEFSEPQDYVVSCLRDSHNGDSAYGARVNIVSILNLVNVILVSAFISFTRLKHPPVIALTIFSYVIHETVSFALASAVVLAIIVVAQYLERRLDVRLNNSLKLQPETSV
jgi:hypothetical protein